MDVAKRLEMIIYELFEDASGVIASKKQAKDPRYSMSLTKDVRPGEIQRQLKKYSLAEDTSPDLKRVGNKFVQHCMKSLGINKLPKIRMLSEIGMSEHPTFGTFDPETNTNFEKYVLGHFHFSLCVFVLFLFCVCVLSFTNK
jgi:hypothetical protein